MELRNIFTRTFSGIILCLIISNSNAQNSPKDQPEANHYFGGFTGQGLENNEFIDVSLTSYQAISSNITFTDKDNVQKLVISPFKLTQSENTCLHGLKLNASNKSGSPTFGVGFTFDSGSPFGKRADSIWKNFDQSKIIAVINNKYAPIVQQNGETNADFNARKTKYKNKKEKALKQLVRTEYYKKLMKNSVKVTLGSNIGMFSTLGGDPIDLDQDTLIDNYFSVRKNHYTAGITYIRNETIGFSANYHYLEERASGEEESPLVPSFGWSAGFDFRVKILNEDYEDTDEYIDELFIPQIRIGAGAEFIRCNGVTDCTDDIRRRLTLSPYIDFKIKPKNQFRIGIPFKFTETSKNIPSLGMFFQYSLQLSSANN